MQKNQFSFQFLLSAFFLIVFPHQLRAQLYLQPFTPIPVKVTDITHCGDQRLFIAEQAGRILLSDLDGNLNSLPFLDIRDKVFDGGGEQGLLGIAFSPDYAVDRRFYVNYINNLGNTVIARFLRQPADENRADSLSEEVLFIVNQPYTNHNGGAMHFGPDGYLYISLGDGGAGGDPGNRAQDLTTRLGKILRIDVSATSGYSIPPDNPFLDIPNADSTIWNYGLRNAWRFSFDRFTGDKWIADVGQNAYEEINFQEASSPGGENYGWRCYEGDSTYIPNNCSAPSSYIFPVYVYNHPGGCSVTGGYVYRGARYNNLFGKYFFTDYCSGKFQSIQRADTGGYEIITHGLFGTTSFTTFGEDIFGELYAGKISGGVVRLADSTCTPVAFIAESDTMKVLSGFKILSTPFYPGYTYRWYFNGSLIPGAFSNVFTARLSGDYRVVVYSPDSCVNTSKIITLYLKSDVVIGIYPNPAHDEVLLNWSDKLPGKKEIEIFDMAGKLVYKKTITGDDPGFLINLRSFANGVYSVKVEHQEKVYSEKLVKL